MCACSELDKTLKTLCHQCEQELIWKKKTSQQNSHLICQALITEIEILQVFVTSFKKKSLNYRLT